MNFYKTAIAVVGVASVAFATNYYIRKEKRKDTEKVREELLMDLENDISDSLSEEEIYNRLKEIQDLKQN